MYRLTFENIENGIVTYGKIASSETSWSNVYAKLLDSWEAEFVIGALLLRNLELTFDRCESPSDIEPHNARIEATWRIIDLLEPSGYPKTKIEELKKYEQDIRTGKAFEEESA